MSLTSSAAEPQPSLAWTFESSNVDIVTGLAPSSQVSPGPAQLQGSAALVTNAPTSNTAVYFPGGATGATTAYMNLGSTSPINFNPTTSNIFYESWVYFLTLGSGGGGNQNAIINTGSFKAELDSVGTIRIYFASTNSFYVPAGGASFWINKWNHVAFSWNYATNTMLIFVNGSPGASISGTIVYSSTTPVLLGCFSTNYAFMNGYIRDMRVVQGGVVPTTSFTPGSAPFSYASPGYVANMGTTVFTLLGQFITYPSGKYGQGIYFNNKNSVGTGNNANTYTYYNISSSLQLSANNLTVSSWVNPYFSIPAPSSNQKWVMIGDSQFTIEFALNTNVSSTIPFVYFAGNNTGLLTGTTPMVQNQWFHQAVTFSNINSTSANTLCSYYFNGAYISSSNVSKTSFSTINGLQIGTGFGNWAGAWVALDDLRIYNTALTAAQVQSVYSSQGAPAPSRAMPLPRYAWDFQSSNVDYVSGLSPATSLGPPTYTSGKYGQAIQFTNSAGGTPSQSLTYPVSLPSSSGLTVSFWVNFNTYNVGFQTPVSLGDGSSYLNIYGTSVIYLYWGRGSTTVQANPGFSYSTGTWYHIAVCYSAQTVTLYINGTGTVATLYISGTPSGTNVGADTTFTTAYLGGSNTSLAFNGLIDDLRIFNTALTAAQVRSIWAQQGVPGRGALVPQSPQPSLAWNFQSSNVDYVNQLAPTTSVGPPTYNSAGKYGSSIVFNNTPGAAPGTYYLTYTTGISLSTASGFTVCAWLKPLAVGVSGNQTFLSIAGQNTFFIFQIDGSATNIHLYGQNPFTVPNSINGSAFSVTQSTWFHAVMVFSGTSITTYYNGTLKDSLSLVVSPVTFSSIGLGNRSAINADSAANCELDDLRVYNTALTAAQVQAIYGTSGMPSRQVLSGTPLFTQLSPAATSSAVGAFSLRAVNGGTAKAVAVQNHPVVQWPPVALTTNPNTLSSQTYGNGTYTISATATTNGTLYNPFSYVTNGFIYWSSPATYNYLGAYTGSNVTATSYFGEWLQIQLPTSITLKTYSVRGRPDATEQTPRTWYIFGSSDGSTWTLLDTQTSVSWPSSGTTLQTFTPSSTGVSYVYFRFVVNAIGTSGYSPPSSISQWILNGSSSSYAPNASQDFYADRRGNLLTAPVTGQSLANWLGGATGYVTTWYDQSGRGNHATQATAANQPKIDLVNKQIDFKPSAYFDLPNGTVPFGNSNYTMIVKHNTINTTWAGIIGSGTYGTQNATNAIETNTTYTNYWWSNDMSGGAYAQGSIISAKYDNTIGRTLYVNGASVATNANKNRNSTNIQNTIGTDLRGNQGQGGGNRYLNGELYYVFLFGSALSDTDRTLVESLPVN